MVSMQPNTTSSTVSGSNELRSTNALITCAPRSAGWTAAKPPLRFPTGVRTASTMKALAMDVSFRCEHDVSDALAMGPRVAVCGRERPGALHEEEDVVLVRVA